MDTMRTEARYLVDEKDTAFDDVFTHAASDPDHVAVSRAVDGTWVPVTNRELADEVEALAAGLLEAGVERGERVALMSRTRYEWLLADVAILSVGAVTVPIYETSSASQIDWILSDSGAVAAFVENDDLKSKVEALRDGLPELRAVWTLTEDRQRLIEDGLSVGSGPTAERRATVRSAELATIVYTSGTTGRPKGCMLTHANLVGTVRNVSRADGVHEQVFNEDQSTLLFLPLAHVLARVIQSSALHAQVRLGHLPDMRKVPAGLQSFRPTVVLSVPRVFEKIYNTAQRTATHGVKKQVFSAAAATSASYSEALETASGPGLVLKTQHRLYDALVYGKLRHAMGGQVRWAVSGGAPLGANLGHFFRGVGVNVLEGYGLTESTAGGTLNLPSAQRVGSVGRPIPGCEIRIAGDGEILMRGVHVFAGYWNNEAATADVLDSEGWLHTGDIGRIDDDGFVFITDRKKDLIVTSAGKNVAPTVLEDRLRSHWLVSQAAVFGDQQPYIAALLTVDPEALEAWQQEKGKPGQLEHLMSDVELLDELQHAVDLANEIVSQAEAIKRWSVLPHDFAESTGELTPTLKMKRDVIAKEFAAEVEALFS